MDFYRPQTKFAKVMFLQVSVCPHEGGGVCGFFRGVWFFPGVWFFRGGGFFGGHECFFSWDTVNEWAVCILLECILVIFIAGSVHTRDS